MSYQKALLDIEAQQGWNSAENNESKLQQILSNPKTLFGLMGARMALRGAATMGDGSIQEGVNTVAMKGATGVPVAQAAAAGSTPTVPDFQEPGIFQGMFNEAGDVISNTMAENPFLAPAGLGLGTLGLMGAYGLKDRNKIQQSATDYKKRRILADAKIKGGIGDITGAFGNSAKSLARTSTGLFMGSQALNMAGVDGMSAAAMPLLGAGMALRSPVGAAAMAGALGQNMGWWDLANASTAATAGLNPMMTGMASIPSLVGHAAAAPLNLMGGLGNEAFGKTMEGAAGGITGVGDTIANMFSGSPMAAMIGGGLSMALAGKGLNKGVGLIKDKVSGESALLKSEKFTVPKLQGAAAEEKRYSRTAQLEAGIKSLMSMNKFTPYESYSLLYLQDISGSNALLRAMFDREEFTSEGKKSESFLVQNSTQARFGHTGDERTDLKQAWYDKSEEYWAPEGTLSRKFDQMQSDVSKEISKTEGMIQKFSIVSNPLNWITGGKSSVSELLKELDIEKTTALTKQQYSQISGESMEFVEAKNVSVTSLMNEADTYEGKVLNILGTLLPLAQERNFTLKDIAKVFGVTPDKSSAGDLDRVVTNVEASSLNLSKKEKGRRFLRGSLAKMPVFGPIFSMAEAYADSDLKEQGKIKAIDEEMVAEVTKATLSDVYANPEVGSALPQNMVFDLTDTNSWLSIIAGFVEKILECMGCDTDTSVLAREQTRLTIGARLSNRTIEDTRQEILDEEENDSDDATQEGILASLKKSLRKVGAPMVGGLKTAGKGALVGLGGLLTGDVSKVLTGLLGIVTGASVALIGPVISALGALGAFLLTPPGIMLAIAGVAAYIFWDEIKESIKIIGETYDEMVNGFTDWWNDWELSDLAPWNWDWSETKEETLIALGLKERPETVKNRERFEKAQETIAKAKTEKAKRELAELNKPGSNTQKKVEEIIRKKRELGEMRSMLYSGGKNSTIMGLNQEDKGAVTKALTDYSRSITDVEAKLAKPTREAAAKAFQALQATEKTKKILYEHQDKIAAKGGDKDKIDTVEEQKEFNDLLKGLISDTRSAAQFNVDGQGSISGSVDALAKAILAGNQAVINGLGELNKRLSQRASFVENNQGMK